jgi:hypothetical protein
MSTVPIEARGPSAAGNEPFSPWLAAHHLPGTGALLISPVPDDVAHLSAAQRLSLVVLPVSPAELRETSRLNFIDSAFETVYLHGVARATGLSKIMHEARRLIRVSGQIVLAADAGDFAFAPLPPGGAEHLLRRALANAGFTRPQTLHRAGGLLIVAARKSQ